METKDHRKPSQSGHEGHVGAHVCHKCGWPFPNPHPSARHRRAHKRVCGTIEGYKLDITQSKTHMDGSDGEQHVSDDEHKTPSEKVVETTISRRSSSGVGSRSIRSADDLFADAATDFVDSPGLGEPSGGHVSRLNSLQMITEDEPDSSKLSAENAVNDNSSAPTILVDDNQLQTVQKLERENNNTEGGIPSQDCISSTADDSTPVSAPLTMENESAIEQQIMQSSTTSTELNLVVEESEEASSKDLSEVVAAGCEVASMMSEDVSASRDMSEEHMDSADGMAKDAGNQTDGFEKKFECSREGDSPVIVSALVDSAPVADSESGNAGNLTDMIGEPDSRFNSNEQMHVVAVPEAMPLQECSDITVEDLDHKGAKLNTSMGPDATLAFETLASGKDAAFEESCDGSDFAKPGESSSISSQVDVLGAVNPAENIQDVCQSKSIALQDIVGETNQTSHDKSCNTDAAEFSKEGFEDILNETCMKEFSGSEEQKSSISSDKVSPEGAIAVDRVDNKETISNAVKEDEEHFVVHEKDGSQVEELAAIISAFTESAPVEEMINTHDGYGNDIVDGGMGRVEDTTVSDVSERIVAEDKITAMSAETTPGYGSTLPGSNEGNDDSIGPERDSNNDESDKTLNFDNVMVGYPQQESLPTSEDVGETQCTGDNVAGKEGINRDGTSSIVETTDCINSISKMTQILPSEVVEDVGSSFPSSTSTEGGRTKKVAENESLVAEVDGTTKEHVTVSAVDTLVDSGSQSDSLEGNWGSVSDMVDPKALDKEGKTSVGEPASQLKQQEDTSEIHTTQPEQLQSSALQTGWSSSVTHVSSNHHARNKNEEVIAKVTNWGNEKQHTPLKTLLGEATARSRAESPTHDDDDDNSIPKSHKEEIPETKNGFSAMTKNVTLETRDEEIGKEWNSPARYPVNIKAEKRRAKSKPYWAPFLCCSSVNAAR